MFRHGWEHGLDVVNRDKVTARQQGHRPSRRQQGLGGAGGQTSSRATTGLNQIQDVINQGVGAMQGGHLGLHGLQALGREHSLDIFKGAGLTHQQRPLGSPVGVPQAEPHQKTIELSLGKWTGADLVKAVLGSDDKKRLWQHVAGAVHTHPSCSHGFQQSALGAGTGTVDLVRQKHLSEQRTRLKTEIRLPLIEEVEAGEIRGEQITGEADPLKRQADTPGEGLGQRGLPHAGCVLDQQMSLGQQTADRQADLVLLAHENRTGGLHQRGQRRQGSPVIHQAMAE